MKFQAIQYYTDKEMRAKADEFWDVNWQSQDLKACIDGFVRDGYFIKDKSNSDENEYRLMYTTDIAQYKFHLMNRNIDNNLDTMVVGNTAKICYGIDLKSTIGDGHPIINNILMGPNCNASTAELGLMLEKHSLFTNGISRSTVHMN